jgi:hypothetical protein
MGFGVDTLDLVSCHCALRLTDENEEKVNERKLAAKKEAGQRSENFGRRQGL